ncbi:MAG TPA: hypothetical protein VJJ79_02250 [Candidatus Nanoarchaeia archaeon]|nr:hypothetical protein [Candidatus Nanoarchaeia archaeon]
MIDENTLRAEIQAKKKRMEDLARQETAIRKAEATQQVLDELVNLPPAFMNAGNTHATILRKIVEYDVEVAPQIKRRILKEFYDVHQDPYHKEKGLSHSSQEYTAAEKIAIELRDIQKMDYFKRRTEIARRAEIAEDICRAAGF